MTKKNKEVLVCDFCGFELEVGQEEEMEAHEMCCKKNPNNCPCSHCANCYVDIMNKTALCTCNCDMDGVDNKHIICFKYVEGEPMC